MKMIKSIGIFLTVRRDVKVLGASSVFNYLFAKVLASEAARNDIEAFCFDIDSLSVDPKRNLFISSHWKWDGSIDWKKGHFIKHDSVCSPLIILDLKRYFKRMNVNKKHPSLAKVLSLKGVISERELGNAILTKFKKQGVKVLNDPMVSSKIRDKLFLYSIALERNFFCSKPRTFPVKDPGRAVDALVSASDGLKGIVLRSVSSSGTAEVFWLERQSLSDIKKQIAKRISSSDKFMLQEFIEPTAYLGAGPLRLRMFYGLGRVFEGYASVFTRPKTGKQFELKRNMRISSSVLTSNEINILGAATSLIGSILSKKGDVFLISVDFLQSATGMYLLEVNHQPAFDRKVQGKDLFRMQRDIAARLLKQFFSK